VARYRLHDVRDGDTIELGEHSVRMLEAPHVHHWISMMLAEEKTQSPFPSHLFLQPGRQPPIVSDKLGAEMCAWYRRAGIFAAEQPVRLLLSTGSSRRASLDACHARRVDPAQGARVLSHRPP
jgi:hypothetical protein